MRYKEEVNEGGGDEKWWKQRVGFGVEWNAKDGEDTKWGLGEALSFLL